MNIRDELSGRDHLNVAPKEQFYLKPRGKINSQAKGPLRDQSLESPKDTEGATLYKGKSLRFKDRGNGYFSLCLFSFGKYKVVKKLQVITNNGMVEEYCYKNKLAIVKVGTLMEVLIKGRDLVHKNYRLLNHPLCTSIKPYPNLYKTIVIMEGERLDFKSLDIIENAINTAKKFSDKEMVTLNSDILRDYQLIDYGVFLETVK
jgi:hypothetical protein